MKKTPTKVYLAPAANLWPLTAESYICSISTGTGEGFDDQTVYDSGNGWDLD